MSRSVSAPSSVTNTSPCWNGLIVPGSTFRYGSNFWTWTLRPRALRSRPSEAATIPLPRPETTPPVTNTYFVARSVVTQSPRDANVACAPDGGRAGACVSTGRFRRTCGLRPHVLIAAPQAVPQRRVLELGGGLDERVQAGERAVRERAAEADQPGAADRERRDRAVVGARLELELGFDPLAGEVEGDPLGPRRGEHEQQPAR